MSMLSSMQAWEREEEEESRETSEGEGDPHILQHKVPQTSLWRATR